MSFRTRRVRQPHPAGGDQVTEQHHEKACNINNIMAKYAQTGLIDHINKHSPKYGDVTGADFKAAMDLVANETSAFYELPAKVRAQFNDDPAEYLDLVRTDEGIEQLRNILRPPKAEPEAETVPKPVSETKKEGDADESAVT